MTSVRFDPDLERSVKKAARQREVTVSEFIRRAVRRECDADMATEPDEDWKALLRGSPHGEEWIRLLDGFVGCIEGDGTSWEQEMDEWADVIYEHNWRMLDDADRRQRPRRPR